MKKYLLIAGVWAGLSYPIYRFIAHWAVIPYGLISLIALLIYLGGYAHGLNYKAQGVLRYKKSLHCDQPEPVRRTWPSTKPSVSQPRLLRAGRARSLPCCVPRGGAVLVRKEGKFGLQESVIHTLLVRYTCHPLKLCA
jgi:hypothetical protein